MLISPHSVMSPSGNLIAYSTPADMPQVRDQAALISMAWREHDDRPRSANGSRSSLVASQDKSSALTALTVEFNSHNIVARLLQPDLVLVLIGGVFSERQNAFKITTERAGDDVYPAGEVSLEADLADVTPLHLQRRKADKLVDFVAKEASAGSISDDIR